MTLLAVTHLPPHFSLSPLLHPKRQSLLNTDRGVAVCLRHSLTDFSSLPLHPRAAVLLLPLLLTDSLAAAICTDLVWVVALSSSSSSPTSATVLSISEAHRMAAYPIGMIILLFVTLVVLAMRLPRQHHQANGRILPVRDVRRHGFRGSAPLVCHESRSM